MISAPTFTESGNEEDGEDGSDCKHWKQMYMNNSAGDD